MAKSYVKVSLAVLGMITLTSCQTTADVEMDRGQGTSGPSSSTPHTIKLDDESLVIPDVGERVQLRGGTGDFYVAPGASKGRVTLIEDSQRVWRTKDRTDIVTVVAVQSGGTGTFYHVAVYSVKDGAWELSDSALLGDRIRIARVGIGELVHDGKSDYRITINMLDRPEDAPMTEEASLPSTRIFYVQGGKLEVVNPGRDDS